MNANDLIEAYVADVMRRLPRRMRNDVGFELRALLGEELTAKAKDAGRAPDGEMALSLLHGFGNPEAVAERYRPEGFEIIPPRRATAFVAWAVGVVALQWAISLPVALAAPHGLSRIGGWWLTSGLGAFWWPGFMVMVSALATWIGRRLPAVAQWTPRLADRDRVNRPLFAAALVFWICGAGVLIALPWIVGRLETTHWRMAAQAFVYDDDFLHGRGLLVLPLWAASFGLCGVLIAQGRWTPLTRRIGNGLNLAFCALLALFLVGGPIWRAQPTDAIAKACIALIILGSLADLGLKAWRAQGRLRTPIGVA
jgi:hypothetical protein